MKIIKKIHLLNAKGDREDVGDGYFFLHFEYKYLYSCHHLRFIGRKNIDKDFLHKTTKKIKC